MCTDFRQMKKLEKKNWFSKVNGFVHVNINYALKLKLGNLIGDRITVTVKHRKTINIDKIIMKIY